MSRTPRTLILPVALLALALAACAPEPAEPTLSTTPDPSASATPTPTPTETAAAGDDIALPAACEELYSAQMLASLMEQAPPLNHPEVTMLATQNSELMEILDSGIPTIRCTWGAPSEFGLATNVSTIDSAQSAAIGSALQSAGFGCGEQLGGTICRIEQKMISQDDQEVLLGETHFVRGNGWVSTAWINFAPEGYTEDIAGTLWG